MRVATWNVNSIRTRLDQLLEWLDRTRPDVVLLQETKCRDADFPISELTRAGFDVAHHGTDHWNGVAIMSRFGLTGVHRGFPGVNRAPFDEARLVSATSGDVRFHSAYAPNGRELDDPQYLFKLVWLERLRSSVDEVGPTVLGGDLNVAPADLDIYEPKRWRRRTHASPPERAAIHALTDLGLVDVTRQHHPGPGVFTWWSYRPEMFDTNRGLRIDLLLASEDIARRTSRVAIDTEVRSLDRPSDHAPVFMDIEE